MKNNKVERMETLHAEASVFVEGWIDLVGSTIFEKETIIKDRDVESDRAIKKAGQRLIQKLEWLIDDLDHFNEKILKRKEINHAREVAECNEQVRDEAAEQEEQEDKECDPVNDNPSLEFDEAMDGDHEKDMKTVSELCA